MDANKRSLTKRIEAKLEAFNQRLEVRLRKKEEIFNNMREAEDFSTSMGYMKEFFGFQVRK